MPLRSEPAAAWEWGFYSRRWARSLSREGSVRVVEVNEPQIAAVRAFRARGLVRIDATPSVSLSDASVGRCWLRTLPSVNHVFKHSIPTKLVRTTSVSPHAWSLFGAGGSRLQLARVNWVRLAGPRRQHVRLSTWLALCSRLPCTGSSSSIGPSVVIVKALSSDRPPRYRGPRHRHFSWTASRFAHNRTHTPWTHR